MPPDLNSIELEPFYYWTGFLCGILPILLFTLSFLLLCIGKPEEKNTKITLIPCLLWAAASLVVFYAYAMELFIAYYSGSKYEMEVLKSRIQGSYWWAYTYMLLSSFLPILLFIPVIRKSLWAILTISVICFSALHLEKII